MVCCWVCCLCGHYRAEYQWPCTAVPVLMYHLLCLDAWPPPARHGHIITCLSCPSTRTTTRLPGPPCSSTFVLAGALLVPSFCRFGPEPVDTTSPSPPAKSRVSSDASPTPASPSSLSATNPSSLIVLDSPMTPGTRGEGRTLPTVDSHALIGHVFHRVSSSRAFISPSSMKQLGSGKLISPRLIAGPLKTRVAGLSRNGLRRMAACTMLGKETTCFP